MPDCNRDASILRTPWPTRDCHRDMGGKIENDTARKEVFLYVSVFKPETTTA